MIGQINGVLRSSCNYVLSLLNLDYMGGFCTYYYCNFSYNQNNLDPSSLFVRWHRWLHTLRLGSKSTGMEIICFVCILKIMLSPFFFSLIEIIMLSPLFKWIHNDGFNLNYVKQEPWWCSNELGGPQELCNSAILGMH